MWRGTVGVRDRAAQRGCVVQAVLLQLRCQIARHLADQQQIVARVILTQPGDRRQQRLQVVPGSRPADETDHDAVSAGCRRATPQPPRTAG